MSQSVQLAQLFSPPPPPVPPHSPPDPPEKKSSYTQSAHPVHKTLASAANLANLLPTGTVLAFRTLIPSFSNKGVCNISNKALTSCLISICAIFCFLSSFTDSFVVDGKLYYGIATFKGLYVFNNDYDMDEELEGESKNDVDLSRMRISFIDFVHAFVSLVVFLVFVMSDSDVQNCLFPLAGHDMDVLVMNLPLGAGVFSSFLFTIFPSKRRGIGYAGLPRSFR